MLNFTNTDVESVPASNSSQSSCRGQRNSTSGQRSGKVVIVSNIKAGHNACQVFSPSANGNLIADKIEAGDNAWQCFGPPELMQQLDNFRQAQNTEIKGVESTTPLLDECASGTARR